MRFTGERMIPAFNSNTIIYIEHLLRYEYAARQCYGKKVLDVACGVGYGSWLMCRAGADSVIGVDISEDAVEYASKEYSAPNLRFICAAAEKMPLADKQFDLIVSFETIEHVVDYRAFISEISRLLKPGGTVIISTPNKTCSSGKNEWHTQEFTEEEMRSVLDSVFPGRLVTFNYQRTGIYSIVGDLCNGNVAFTDIGAPNDRSYFVITISGSALEETGFVGLGALTEVDMLRDRICGLEASVSETQGEMARREGLWSNEITQRELVVRERDREIGELREEIVRQSADLHREMAHREELWAKEVENRENVIVRRDKEVQELREEIVRQSADLHREMAHREELWAKEVENRESVIQQRDMEIEQLREEIVRQSNDLHKEMAHREELWAKEVEKREESIQQCESDLAKHINEIERLKRTRYHRFFR